MKIALLAALAALLAGYTPASVQATAGKPLTLAVNGKSDYQIVLAKGATGAEKFAAEELQLHLEQATGAKLEIVDAESVRVPQKSIFLIRVPASAGFAPEECRVRTEGSAIVIEGEGNRGVPYGVYAFLERKLGARWFTSTGDSKIDKKPTFVLEPFSFAEKQAFRMRGILTIGRLPRDRKGGGLFLFRNRLNDAYEADWKTRPEGLVVTDDPWVEPIHHNSFYFLPPTDYAVGFYRLKDKNIKTYFKDHPEWYAMKENGKRVGDDYAGGQLCYSNREMREELMKVFFAYVEKKGAKGIFSIDPQDNPSRLCWCKDCVAMVEKYKTEGAPFFDCVFEIARIAKTRYPKVSLILSAYNRGHTQVPPTGMGPVPDNVLVTFAPRDFDYSKPLTSESDKGSLDDFRRWCQMAKTINRDYPFIYATGVPPYHCFARVAESVRLGYEWGAFGCNFEHDEGTYEGRNFFDIQTWMLMQQYRFPEANWHDLAQEFCDGVFGPAAGEIMGVIDLFEEANAARKTPFECHSIPEYAFTPERLVRFYDLFEKAEAKARGDAALLQRIREVRLGFDMVTLGRYRDVKKKYPDFAPTPESFYDRGTNAFIAARLRRGSSYETSGEVVYPYFGPMRSAYTCAKADLKPLPKFFDQFGRDRLIELYPHQPSGHLVWVTMRDAALGYAAKNNIIDGGNSYFPKSGHQVPFMCGLYDWAAKRDIFRSWIKKEEIVPDEFHFYKVGRGNVPNARAMLFIGWDWGLNEQPFAQLGGDPAAIYDVYLSIKFEGPTYSSKSKKAKDAYFVDRYVFVRVK